MMLVVALLGGLLELKGRYRKGGAEFRWALESEAERISTIELRENVSSVEK
jgi:hypothetical protein